MQIIYMDSSILVCVKPPKVLSTDEPGGLPELLRRELGDEQANLRTVHRLDRAASGLMVLARSSRAASELSRQIREGGFEKEYMAVACGEIEGSGSMRDFLIRDKARKMTFVTDTPAKGVQEALLDYEVLGRAEGLSLVRIRLHTGRTHQIRCQFASRGLPLAGDRKYGGEELDCPMALWSCMLGFAHPRDGRPMHFFQPPPAEVPWDRFEQIKNLTIN